MFAFIKLSAVALTLASFAQATITIAQPVIKANSTNTLTWNSDNLDADPATFSIELINKVFNSQFAVGNNIQTAQGSFTFQLPVVDAGPGYTIEFVNPGNINDIFATSAPFSVQANDASSSTTSGTGVPSTTGATSGTASGTAGTVPRTSSGSTSHTGTVVQSATTPLTTPTAPSTTGASTGSGSSAGASSPGSGTSSGAPATTSKPNAAGNLTPTGSLAALIAGALALLI